MANITLHKYLFLVALILLFSPTGIKADDNVIKRKDSEIDAQLDNMRNMLPVEIQNGIRWIDIKRNNKEILYTYIVNVNSADWNDTERVEMMSALQDFGCRQLLPAMCEGSKVIFDSGYTATTTYHDSFGNYLFDCTFTPENCSSWQEYFE